MPIKLYPYGSGIKLSELKPWAKISLIITGIGMFALLFGGIFMWPDAPIKECGAGYCGKHGLVHTAADYQVFKKWESALIIVWPVGMIAALYFRTRKR